MRIIGGNFGLGGLVFVRDEVLIVDAEQGVYSFEREDIRAVSSRVSTERKFGCIGFVIAAIIFGVLFGFVLGLLGVLIGVILAAAGSWYTSTSYEATIGVTNNRQVTVSCTKRDIKDLSALTL